jgi:hypothetical protein
MRNVPRTAFCTIFGALQCAILAAVIFTVGAVLDGTAFSEALAFAVVAGVIAAFFGALIGFVIGIFDLSPLLGGLAGVLATLAAVGFYVLTFGRPNQYGYFLGESAIIVVVLALPAILTGVLTTLEKNLLFE